MSVFGSLPLISDDTIKIYDPDLNFYLEKIKELEYFSMMRFADWWWNAISIALEQTVGLNEDVKVDNRLINRMGERLLKAGRSDPYVSSLKVIKENMRTTIAEQPDNMFFSVKSGPPHWPLGGCSVSVKEMRRRRRLIKALTSKDEFLYAHAWRNFATTGEIHRLFEENPDYHFVIVGPFYYKNFGRKIGLKNFSLIEIHETHEHKYVDRTISKIVRHRNSIDSKKVVYLFSAGSVSTYMISKLHNLVKNAFLIDVGRSLDAYYCHDSVLKKGPHWRWSGAWFGDQRGSLKKWTRWTRKYRS